MFGLFFMNCFCFASESNYGNIFAKNESPFGIQGNNVRLFDVLEPIRKCKSSEKFFCLESNAFSFAIPRHLALIKTWTYSNAEYNILFERTSLFRQKPIKYRIIRQKRNDRIVEYAHSDEYGVIGIKADDGNQLTIMDKCGFAVLSGAKGCKPD